MTYQIIGAAIEVHKATGPGLLESVYHKCMKRELALRKINFTSEQLITLEYKNELVDCDLRCDTFVENLIAVEFKSIQEIAPVHEAQVLTYMKLLKIPKGILINFNTANIFKRGQKTFVNEFFSLLPEE